MLRKIVSAIIFLSLTLSLLPESALAFTPEVFKKEVKESFLAQNTEYTSRTYATDFSFRAILPRWSENLNGAEIFVGFGETEEKLKWIEAQFSDAGFGGKDGWRFGDIIPIGGAKFFQYKIIFSPKDLGKKAEFFFDLYDVYGSGIPVAKISADGAGLGPNIISRKSWEANEGYMKWAPEYAEVKAIVIHHTAGEQAATTTDQAAAMRNLYYGHAVSFGWGDIGYNYVVDANGAIYEGRAGGNSAVAGHALGYNYGTIGISVIGDYTTRVPSADQTKAIEDLVAYLAYKNNLDIGNKVFLKDKTINVVSGHRDLNPTACPGENIYIRMDEIRMGVAEKLKNYPAKNYSAQVSSVSQAISLSGGETRKVSVSVKNNSNTALLSAGSQTLALKSDTAKLSSKLVNFGRSIEAGETKNVEVELTAPFTNEVVTTNFSLTAGGIDLPGTNFSVTATIATPRYKAKISAKSPDQTIRPSAQGTFWVEVKNMGADTWDGGEGMSLTVRGGKESDWYTAGDWETKSVVKKISTAGIASGGTTRVSFVATSPAIAGQYRESFLISSTKEGLVGGADLEANFVLTSGENGTAPEPKVVSKKPSDYSFTISSQSDQKITMLPNETRQLFVELKNTGQATWYGDTVKLGTMGAQDRASSFANSAWVGQNRIETGQYKIAPGGIARYGFSVTAPAKTGNYKEQFALVVEGVAWIATPIIFWEITVAPPTYTADIVEQSPYVTTLRGGAASLSIKFKNTGNITWDKKIVHLGATIPDDRKSVLASSWLAPNRVEFAESPVAPGSVATFNLPLNTNVSEAIYKEYFELVADGIAWFPRKGIYWNINIAKPFDDFQYIGQSPAVILQSGDKATLWIDLKNTGTSTWKKSSSDPMRLGTKNPQDRISSFTGANRVPMDQNEVAPQATARFTFEITAPAKAGVYKEYFAPVHDGVGWLRDIGIYWQITVNANNSIVPPSSDDAKKIKVSANGDFYVTDGNNKKVADALSGAVGETYWQNGAYYLNINGQNFTTTTFYKFVPTTEATIMEIKSYNDRPAWNTSLNDNTYQGTIEIRYSTANKKLWAINELPIEEYLKGVSEPLDTFAPEYLKVATTIERSYVYYHLSRGGRHPADFLTLKNSRLGNGDDQIYAGYGFTKRAPNTSLAVDATKGEIVAYNGNSVVTPYFSQSDGRTRSASEVWGWTQANFPWLVGRDDPYSSGLPLLGHGVGLSARGARGMVSAGKNYKEVLNYFYTDTTTKILDTSKMNVRIGIYYISL